MIITIDGPAGAGKSTVAHALARRLGFQTLDTGALYRAATLKARRLGLPLDDERSVVRMLRRTRLEIRPTRGGLRVLLDGRDVSRAIRCDAVTRDVRHLASAPAVRRWMNALQRAIVKDGDYVGEGRDLGTVVFPRAAFKFYLDASPSRRAERRLRDLRSAGQRASLARVLRDIRLRDASDRRRKVAPLRCARDAVRIDSTRLSADEVVSRMADHLRAGAGRAGRPRRPGV